MAIRVNVEDLSGKRVKRVRPRDLNFTAANAAFVGNLEEYVKAERRLAGR